MAGGWRRCSSTGSRAGGTARAASIPSRSQYKEFFVTVNALWEGEEVAYCPYIWVDRDFALARGWIQGFPKKLGSIWMTRTFGLDTRADPGMKPGATYGGTCAAYERRLAEATVTLERPSPDGPTHNAPPIVNRRHFPRLEKGRHEEPAVHELVRSVAFDRSASEAWEGSATLELFDAPRRGARRAGAAAGRQGLPPDDRLLGRRPRDARRAVSATPAAIAEVAGVEVPTDHLIGGERVGFDRALRGPQPDRPAAARRGRARGRGGGRAAMRGGGRGLRGLGRARPGGPAAPPARLAELIDANVERIAAVECEDMAMLLESLRLRVIGRGARNYRAYAELAAAYEERVWSSNGTANRVIRMPAGPAVVITPWNAPFMLSTWKTAPALAAGCTVVLKPAEWSPLSCSLLAELTVEAGLPPGVFNVVQGLGEEVGAALVSHPLARRISFTGSPETARSIGRAAADNIVPFTGELGGKGPLLVFDDADLDEAATARPGCTTTPARSAWPAPGCSSRRASPRSACERFEAAVAEHVLGDPREPGTTISPLIHPDHLARVEGFVERAREAGDEIAFGGRRAEVGGATASGTSRP